MIERFAVYYEGGTVDRFFVAPSGLGLSDAKKQRVSKLYKTEWGAREQMVRLVRGAK